MVTTEDADGNFVSISLAPYNETDGLGEIASTATDVVVAADGSFTADFPLGTLVSTYSPTGTDVTFDVTFTATGGESTICGSMSGSLPSVNGLDVGESTFGSTSWDGVTTMADAACGGAVVVDCGPRMVADDCPTLVAGANTGFVSCGEERSFVLVEPDGVGDELVPLLFSYHGLGGDAAGYMAATGFDEDTGMYIVAPDGMGLAGTEYAQTTTGDGADLALFDDLNTCMDAQFNIDDERIFSEGMSAGGLFTTYLAVMRPDVLASVVPFSGGLIIDYPAPTPTIPILISWGGEEDLAVGQNFNNFANDLMTDALGGGHFMVACDHGEQHTRKPEWSAYALQFLLDHPKGETEVYAGGLPEAFPDFCSIPTLD